MEADAVHKEQYGESTFFKNMHASKKQMKKAMMK